MRDCLTNYIGCIGDVCKLVRDYAIPEKKMKVQCKWISRKTETQCITILSTINTDNNHVYCSVHQQKMSYGFDTPLAAPKKSSNKKKRKVNNTVR